MDNDNVTCVGELLNRLDGKGLTINNMATIEDELASYFDMDLDTDLSYTGDLDEQVARRTGGRID